MTTYQLPPEPAGPVWLDSDRIVRTPIDTWLRPSDGATWATWTALLSYGEVTDEDPSPDPLASWPLPWETDGRVIRVGTGAPAFMVDTESDDRAGDFALAAHIVEAVNAYAARDTR